MEVVLLIIIGIFVLGVLQIIVKIPESYIAIFQGDPMTSQEILVVSVTAPFALILIVSLIVYSVGYFLD